MSVFDPVTLYIVVLLLLVTFAPQVLFWLLLVLLAAWWFFKLRYGIGGPMTFNIVEEEKDEPPQPGDTP